MLGSIKRRVQTLSFRYVTDICAVYDITQVVSYQSIPSTGTGVFSFTNTV